MYKLSQSLGTSSFILGGSTLLPLTLKCPLGTLSHQQFFFTIGLVSRIVSFKVAAFIKTEGRFKEETKFVLSKNTGKNDKTKYCLSS